MALCATLGIEDIIATQIIKRDTLQRILQNLETWQGWIKPRQPMKRAILAMTLAEPPADAPDLRKAALA